MTPEELTAARAFPTLPGWTWELPGARGFYEDIAGPDPFRIITEDECDNGTLAPGPGGIPDLDDDATIGVIVARVRVLYNDPTVHVLPNYGGWAVCHGPGLVGMALRVIAVGPTEPLALFAAMKGAP